jgi:hypothetical protein
VVAGGFDEGAREGEVMPGGGGGAFGEGKAGEAKVGVGLVEAEAAAGGEGEGFVEVLASKVEGAGVGVEGGAGEEAEGEVVLLAGSAEAVNGFLEVEGSLDAVTAGATLDGDDVSPTEREVFERNQEEPTLRPDPLEGLLGALEHIGLSVLIEQEIAVPEIMN